MISRFTKYAALGLLAVVLTSSPAYASDAAIALGERLFNDDRFSAASGDMSASCASCHFQSDPQGDRAFTELLSRSWHPWRAEHPERETLRNTPTLLDIADMPLLHFDGEFSSPEEQARKTIVGRNFGWLPNERQIALDQAYSIVQADSEYAQAFKDAYKVTLASLSKEETLNWLGTALGDFMRSLKSDFNSPYDDFVKRNKLDAGPPENESTEEYAFRFLGEIERLEFLGKLNRPDDFPESAVEGLKVFFTTSGRSGAGSCVTCHVPPLFTDFAFHNTGVTQMNYDAVHGSGSYNEYQLPKANETQRPSKTHMSRLSKENSELIDLGYWNFADAETSPFRRDGESVEAFMTRTVGAFKTPTLRHLGSTEPYGHTGTYSTIENVLMQKIEAGFLMRQGQMHDGDEVLPSMRVYEDDIGALFDFLNALNDRGKRKSVRRAISSTGDLSSYYQSTQSTPDN